MKRLSFRARLALIVAAAVIAFTVGLFAQEPEDDGGIIAPCPPACGCPKVCKTIEFQSIEWWFSVCGGWPKSCSLHPEEEQTLIESTSNLLFSAITGRPTIDASKVKR